jgi:hypothetical protein
MAGWPDAIHLIELDKLSSRLETELAAMAKELAEARACLGEAMDSIAGKLYAGKQHWARWEKAAGKGEG